MKKLTILIIALTTFISCNNDDDSSGTNLNDQINKFIYNGLDEVYLFKDSQPLFYEAFYTINSGSPEDFFEKLTVEEDRFSWIVDDFEVLEAQFQGTSLTDGMDFNLSFVDSSEDKIVAIVNYVPTDSPAGEAGMLRGDFFTTINGTEMDRDNYIDLISLESYNIDRLNSNFEFIETVSITKEEFTEAPIGEATTIEIENTKVGYLLYNSFVRGSEEELNIEFANFKAENINELIIDLRYNGGGSVATTIDFAGMITGQFAGEVFVKEQWNSELQEFFENEVPERLINNFSSETSEFGTPLNSLGLTRLYVISSGRTASASEMIINSLSSYIEVIHIGESNGTVGKSQASTTLYDSENFGRDNASANHKYAIQPLIFKSVNRDDLAVPNEGLTPDVIAAEDLANLGVLGDINEPLLSVALELITGTLVNTGVAAKNLSTSNTLGKVIGSSKMTSPMYQRMYDGR